MSLRLLMALAVSGSFLAGCQPKRDWDNPLEPYRDQPPPVPELASPVSGSTGVRLSPQLVWRASIYAEKYDVQASSLADFSTLVASGAGLDDTVFQLSDLDTNITYYWRARAGNGNGYSAWSASSSFRTATVSVLLQDGLAACYRFSGNINDSVGTYNGTGYGFAYTADRFGNASSAAYFDGINDYIWVYRMVEDDFSIVFWFKSDQGVGSSTQWYDGAGMVDAEYSGVADDFGTSLNSSGRILAGTGNPDVHVYSQQGYNNNLWHFVAFTRSRGNGELKLYVNDTLQATATSGTQALTSSSRIYFGRLRTGVTYFRGSLDDIRFYSRALSPLEVHCLYTAQ